MEKKDLKFTAIGVAVSFVLIIVFDIDIDTAMKIALYGGLPLLGFLIIMMYVSKAKEEEEEEEENENNQ